MGLQQKRVDLSQPWEKADLIKEIRSSQQLVMIMLKDSLGRDVVRKATEGRTDVVLPREIRQALRATLERAGFSATNKQIEKYL